MRSSLADSRPAFITAKGYLGIGGIHFAAAARNARSPGSVPSLWLLDGSLNRVSSPYPAVPFADSHPRS
jgi:hypothetical protein